MSSVARQMVVASLLLATIIGLFVAAQLGQRRVEAATATIETGAKRQAALGEVWQLVRQAESSQRGYILLGNAVYLTPFQDAAARLTPALERLDAVYATASDPARSGIARLKNLSDAKFDEMSEAVQQFGMRGKAAAMQIISTDAGETMMAQIDEQVRAVEALDAAETLEATHEWQTSRVENVITTSAALLASATLLFFLSRLMLRQWRAKEEEAEQHAARHAVLERLVEERTEELSELSTHLQSLAEQEKSALARELHDELGGLLVAARMDVSWLQERLANGDPEVEAFFKRVQDALQSGFDIKRRVIESLRPTLLDNLGLVPALRWQVAEYCERAGLRHFERYPHHEPRLTPEASIAVFRIVQEALTNVLKHAHAHTVEVSVEMQPTLLQVRVRDDGIGVPPERLRALQSHGLAAMRQRARAFGGHWQIMCPAEGGTLIEVRLPLERVLEQDATAGAGQRSA